ncbi:pre-rRNA-processing protein TSR1 homolog [Babylonia areolata]|uniref:pre-rRNA-processing protein TSR1 homolog n=1 Tax=Babylonia areolata TaxID=304850 RepID=UPI003FD2FC2D
MALEQGTRHRAGSLKQHNKTHKHGRHRTKGEISRENQGRVNVKTLTKKLTAAEKQAVRRNQAKQARKLKREQCFEKKRQRGGQHSPPHFVVVVGLSVTADCTAAMEQLCHCVEQMDGGLVTRNDQGIVHLSIPRFKQRLAYFIASSSLHSILDAAKVADSVVFVTSPDDVIDDMGDYCLKCLMAQGMSSSVFVCQGLNQVPQKKLAETRKLITKEIEKRIPDSKVHSLDNEQDALLLIRKLTDAKTKPVHYREIRPHMVAESISLEAESAEAMEGTLKVSGYLRGADMSADRLVHVVGWGTFQIAQIDSTRDPHPLVLRKEKAHKGSSMEQEEDSKVLARPDPRYQMGLDCEVEVDPMAEEQTWPTEEELADAEESSKQKPKVLDYQGHWLFPDDVKDDEDSDDDDEEESDEDMEADSDDDSWKTCSDADETESVAMTETEIGDDKYDVHFDEEAEKLQLKQLREERENVMFPDEIDTPVDVPARERFARYRGLTSFRTSPWPADEELPLDYQRIFKPGDMKALKKRVLKADLTNSVMMGQYITVHIKGVPKAYMEAYTPTTPMVLFGLLPFEQKITVVHMAVKRSATFQDTVKSKARLHFQVGFRRFSACPIFSELRKGDKQKMERFLPHDDVVVMSVFAPITIGSCPVMVFKENTFGEEHLLGTGSLHSVNPDRIILKRNILSGHILKMGKRKTVVRFMFFNREDINWFKPIELRTKTGRNGRILEPLGTHGHMKCIFNGRSNSQDVVLMCLYKRVFPKWTYEPAVPVPTCEN